MRESQRDRQALAGDDPILEKKDSLAMWVSGLLVIGLPCLLLILLIIGATWLLFGR